MANLLPLKERKHFEREYLLRLVILVLLFFLLSTIFGVILLLPSYFVSSLKEETITRQSELLDKAIESRGQNTSVASFTATKNKIQQLTEVQKQVPQTELIHTVVKNLSPQVTVDAFYYTNGSASQLRITGRSDSRVGLIEFADRLRAESLFNSVDLPVSSLARDSNIVFSITLVGNF